MKEEYIARGPSASRTGTRIWTRVSCRNSCWLSADAKNRHYKAPLREYLVRNNSPSRKA